MSYKVATFLLVLVVVLASAARGASGSVSMTVPVGQWVTLSISGIVRADTSPADVAIASVDADAVRIYGLRPGVGTLVLTGPDGVEARPIQVVAAASAGLSLMSQVGRCPTLSFINAAGPSHIALDAADLALDWTPSTWRLEWTPPDVRILASSALTTPFQQLGVPAALGLQVDWHDQWRLIAGDGLGLVGYHVQGAGTVAVGESAQGPAGFVDLKLGDVSVSAGALKSQAGQLVSGAQAAVNVGPVDVAYTTGQAGGSPTIQFRSGTVSASAGTSPGQGLHLGVGVGVTPGWTIDSSWTAAGAWQVNLAVSIGGGAAQTGAASNPTIASKGQDPACPP